MDARSIPEERATGTARVRPAESIEQTHRARAGRAYLARSLGWSLRLAQLRAEAGATPSAPPGSATGGSVNAA